MSNRLSALFCLCLLLSACGTSTADMHLVTKICAHPLAQNGGATVVLWHGTGPDMYELKTTDSEAPFIFFDASGNTVFSLQNGLINEKYSIIQLQNFQKIRGDRKEGESIPCSHVS